MQSHKLWLYELGTRTELTFMDPDGYETDGYGTNALGYAPSLRDDDGERLWVRVNDKVYLEKRDGSNGQSGSSRWCEPESLNEGIIQMNSNGVAITQTKVWRNGKYTPINDLVGQPESSDLNVTKLIDLASNGIILAEATENGVTKTGLLLPVEVIELSPKLVDESDVEIANSEKPASLPESTEMVERDPLADPQILGASTIRVAWRDMKVKIGKNFAGKEVTWSMTPQFTPSEEFWPGVPYPVNHRELRPVSGGSRFRGSWTHAASANHKHRFSPSTAYPSEGLEGNFNFINFFPPLLNNDGDLPQGSSESEHDRATTTVDSEGYTAIRVNMPPIGFNKAKIKIQIESVSEAIDLIDLEVPAVVVIDPGHGGIEPETVAAKIAAGYTLSGNGEWTLGGSATNHAISNPSKALEKDMTLDFCLLLRDRLKSLRNEQNSNLKLYLTRDADENSRLSTRANFARDYGADQFLSIHFNGYDKTVRGCETHVDHTGNLNEAADMAFAGRVNASVYGAFHNADSGAVDRGAKSERGLDVLSDPSLGNTATYQPCRAVLLEAEFIDVPAVDQLLNIGTNHQAVRQAAMNAAADALLRDLRVQPAQ